MRAPLVRPAAPTDLPFLYRLAAEVGGGWYRICREGLPPPPLFERLLWNGTRSLLVVEHDERAVGAISVYDWLPHHGVISFDTPHLPDTPLDVMGAAVAATLDRTADDLPFRRAYSEAPEFAPVAVTELPARFAPPEVEARLPGAVFADDWFWDLVVTTVARLDLPDVAPAGRTPRS